AKAVETRAHLTPEQRQLAAEVQEVEAAAPPTGAPPTRANELWRRKRIERILGFGATSPSGGFGGGS
ncbi:MAG: hypothetical protein M3032_13005, partial [Verrucomicrobiota bacterium]|nr:hypothetical protein [Verrucomicrobiota bacterium]